MIEKIRKLCKKYLNGEYLIGLFRKIAQVLLNPRLLLCFGIAWMITNGWSYVFVTLGTLLDIAWMRAAGAFWLALLWLPFTPEKIITFIIAIFLMKLLFPNDEKTLGFLNEKLDSLKDRRATKRAPDKGERA